MVNYLTQFKSVFEGDFHFDDLHKTLYATDASVYRKIPLAVAFPKNTKAIKQLIAFAKTHKTSLIPRTAGTSLAGQCVGEGIVVDVSKYFTNIVAVDATNKTVTVEPGVIRDELNAFLAPHGLFFGPNTSTSNRCMIGGMVGNNSSGTTSIQYGVTRDKVLKLKTILADGTDATFSEISSEVFHIKREQETLEGQIYSTIFSELSSEEAQNEIRNEFPKPKIHRRNTGYAVDMLLASEVFGGNQAFNMCKLLAGSEGTLAFTTEITLELDTLPPKHEIMVVAHYKTLTQCLHDVNEVMKHNLFSCEMIDDTILNCTKSNAKYEPYRFFVEGEPKALLLLELRSTTEDDLTTQTDSLLETLKTSEMSYRSPVLKGEEITMAMELRKAGLGLLGNMVGDRKAVACIEDTAVALADLPAYIKEFTALMERYKQDAVYYAHAGAGELHLRPILNLKDREGVEYFRKITTDVAKLTKKYRGSFSGEHGDGIVRAEFLPFLIGDNNYQRLKRIKTTFDPHNILNPGKIIDAYKMDESLRYQPEQAERELPTILDFDDSQGILKLAEKCNGSGDCRKSAAAPGTMCPSYQATKNEKDTTRARANMLREVLTNNDAANAFDSEDLKEVMNLCLSCKACATECPSNVDIASAKVEFLYQYRKTHGTSRADTFFGKSSYYNQLAAKFPRISNTLFRNKLSSKWIKSYSGIAQERDLPNISTNKLEQNPQTNLNQQFTHKSIVLFVDEFSKHLETSIAQDAYDLLRALNYDVTVVDHLDSARALLSKGFLEEAKQAANTNISFLAEIISKEKPLIGIEPSAILGFRDEYLRLADDIVSAKDIATHTYLIEEFLASEISEGNITSEQFTSEERNIKIHVHCHQKALSNQKVTFDILNLPKHYKPTLITSGCCGMAGSFGYEKEHYEVSMQIGELRLFPAIRRASKETIIAANGTSCRHQIKDGTSQEALHPVTILKNALL